MEIGRGGNLVLFDEAKNYFLECEKVEQEGEMFESE